MNVRIFELSYYLWPVVIFIEVVEISARSRDIMYVINCDVSVYHRVLEMRACYIPLTQEITKHKHHNLRLRISLVISFAALVYMSSVHQILLFSHHFSNCLVFSKPLIFLLLEVMWFLSIGFLLFFLFPFPSFIFDSVSFHFRVSNDAGKEWIDGCCFYF